MDTGTQGVPGYHVWQPQDSAVTVHLSLDVVDQLGPEIMRGFGAVPKRGAEVGGILLGSMEEGVVRVDDFEPVVCDYKRGPSYLFSDEDALAFEDAWARNQPDGASQTHAVVGYYRSHTRDGMSLAPEDLDLMDRYFPDPEHIALLVRPYATKVSVAGFFVRDEQGLFPSTTPLEFPFRRRELTGEEPPRRRTLMDRRPDRRPDRIPTREPEADPARSASSFDPRPDAAYATTTPAKSKMKRGWVWMPLSFVFLLLGVLLGFQSALTIAPKPASKGDDYSLALSVVPSGDNLTIRWNRDAPAMKAAIKGVLEIEDGGSSKPVELDAAHLQGGSIIYRNSSDSVRLKLIVYMNARLTVTETLEWKQ